MTTPPAAAPAHAHAAGQRLGIVFVAVSALAFGAMAIMARAAFASGVDTPTLLALRFAIATACMLAIVRARAMPLPRGAELARLSALGALGYGGQAFTFFTALTLAPAGLTALLLYLHPAIVALLAALFLHERITLAKLGALALALAGMVLTVAPALGGDGAGQYPRLAAGVAFGIAAAVIYAVYIVAGTRITARVAPLAMSSVVIASAGAVFVLAALIRGPQWPQTGAGWLAIAGIALLSTVAAISLFFAGLARVGPTRASTLSTIEPLFTVVLAASLLGERILPAQIAGGALILGAVLILARASSTKEP